MSNQRIANFVTLLSVMVCLVVYGQLLSQAWGYFQLSDSIRIGRFGVPWFIAAAMAVPTWLLLRREQANTFLLEVIGELKEVTWPTGQETVSHTRVVIVTVIVVSLILGGFDVVWAKLSKLLLTPNI